LGYGQAHKYGEDVLDESTIPITNRMTEIKKVVTEPIGVKIPKN